MKISIITVCYNAAQTLEDTFLSLQNQSYKDIEHILIDGGSTDKIVQKYEKSLAVMISEPDNGIYDAMNKGLAQATGDVIGFLNADDMYANDRIVEKIAEVMNDPAVDCCYSDLVYVQRQDSSKVVRYWKSCEYNENLYKTGWCPPHPTFFTRRRVYQNHGSFDTDFVLAADFDLLLRFLTVQKISSVYIPMITIKMRLGGATNNSVSNLFRQNIEIINSYKKYNIPLSIPHLFFNKLSSRFRQFLPGKV